MLKARNVKKAYKDLQVLKGVDLTIQDQEIISIVGASGAGKSTLLHILGTLDQADQGTVEIAETEIAKLNPKQLAAFRNDKIGFIFQFHNLLPEFTALENVCIPAFIKGDKAAEAKAKELLDMLELAGRTHHKPSELSGGEQQR
ncbi:MAG: ATP-binding cassette domain-containing protein, partial [Bacteroidota bacterium]